MNEAKYQEARAAYDAGDHRTAAQGFLKAVGQGGPEGNGAAYHMAGNSLMRLRRYTDAIKVFNCAIQDPLYDRHGAVRVNLGRCLTEIGEYATAIEAHRAALAEPEYRQAYNALQGMGSALVEMGRYEEAAQQYREAALDPANPDPGKALVNLGMCFMALGRPSEAAEAYKAALGFDQFMGRGRALSNLGIALSASGDHPEAVKAFEKAIQRHGYELPEAARAAFELSRAAVHPPREVVEGWSTGELAPTAPEFTPEYTPVEVDGWSTGELRAMAGDDVTYDSSSVYSPATDADEYETGSGSGQSASATEFGTEEDIASFFSLSEDDMLQRDRDNRRAERQARRAGSNPFVAIGGLLVALVVICAAVAGAYLVGYGWPTQTQTVKGVLGARATGKAVAKYWVAVPQSDVTREMAKIPPVKSYEIDKVKKGAKISIANVTITPQRGAPLHYQITLAREGVGWKVIGIENDWRSTGGGS